LLNCIYLRIEEGEVGCKRAACVMIFGDGELYDW